MKNRTAHGGGSKANKGQELDAFCAWDGDTLVLNILGTPAASRDAIGRPKGKQLRVSVTEKPVRGRATDHMVRFLADKFGVAVSDIEVMFGRYNVNKQLRIRAPQKLPAVVARQLAGADGA
ncbi:MAG TPA: DUF167 family protein [Mariprofundaceae bacterium]|nr:DUF167 family protein [Mariprofundaceae bacterium]